ncbi:hypothetical protein IDM40_18925 [Nocardiopsis sp. HNM0947]|uniref:DUF559 domain-containing protein n=1 Tax=Nocardiopsis coralli TaxID=2772213 RepID=A0ABR9PA92_9ACTN|nr:hypothetical protein [Nocardiopsis coralli]MBE3000754.1 hypothetical protein [Nocardiopsis coralli]
METEEHLPARLPDHDALLARAAELREHLHPAAVLAERSAAYVWGVDAFPDRRDAAEQVQHVCLPPHARNPARPSVRVHRVRLEPDEHTRVSDVPVTVPLRTALDCAVYARSLYLATGLVDRFLAAGLVGVEELAAQSGRTRSWRARERLERVLALASPASQSQPESWARVLFREAGLPPPTPQCPVSTARGLFHADLGWPHQTTVVEFDSVRHHHTLEQRRQDGQRWRAMVRAGWAVVSVNLHDLGPGAGALVLRLRRVLQARGWWCTPPEAERLDRSLWRLRRRAPVLR